MVGRYLRYFLEASINRAIRDYTNLDADDFALGSGKEAALPNFTVEGAAFIVSKN